MAHWKIISLLLFYFSLDGCFCFSKNAVAPEQPEISQSVPSVVSVDDGVKQELKAFVDTLTYKQIVKFRSGQLPIDIERKLTKEQQAEHNYFMQCVEERYQKDKLFIMMMYQKEGT